MLINMEVRFIFNLVRNCCAWSDNTDRDLIRITSFVLYIPQCWVKIPAMLTRLC